MKIGRVLPLAAGLLLGASQLAVAANQTFVVNDTPGHWLDAGPNWDLGGTRSLVVVNPGDKVFFTQTQGPKAVESRHTVTSLIWPAGSLPEEKIDQDSANMQDHEVTLQTTGLHVFVCKLHPYMLGAVIVDDPATPGFDIGQDLVLLGGAGWHSVVPNRGGWSADRCGPAGIAGLLHRDQSQQLERLHESGHAVRATISWGAGVTRSP